jgi:hypothetical protein
LQITKIPGLGDYGVFIDKFDMKNASDEEWMMLGDVHLNSLVTIIRDVNVTPHEYEEKMHMWGTPRANEYIKLMKKYNISDTELTKILTDNFINGKKVDSGDRTYIQSLFDLFAQDIVHRDTALMKVTGRKKDDGSPLGMFNEGELLWHSNESGNLIFSPGVSLMGVEGLVGSATGFVTTANWYENQTETFRSELDEIIIKHQFTPGRINPGLLESQDGIMHRNMCPEPVELPLVALSPGGIKGLHYSINTIHSVKGMTKKQSTELFEYINKTLFVEEYIYDHWYTRDNDLCLFDNSITLHRRKGGITDRLALRIQYVYDKIVNKDWCPWLLEPYKSKYHKQLNEYNSILNNWSNVQ